MDSLLLFLIFEHFIQGANFYNRILEKYNNKSTTLIQLLYLIIFTFQIIKNSICHTIT